MSKFVQLLTSAYVNGALRHPHEGVLHLEDDEAKRLIDNGAGQDVTSDFSADQKKETPVEALDANSTATQAAAAMAPVEHQANIPVVPTTEAKKEAKK